LTKPEKLALPLVTVGGAANPTDPGVPPALSPLTGGSSRLKNVVWPGCSAGEKLTIPWLVSVLTFVK
jgi:hypothetical protein